MVKLIKSIFLLFIVYANLNAQNILNWEVYSNMDNVVDLMTSDNGIWVATSGGAYLYNPEDSSFVIINKADNINSQNFTSIFIDTDNKIWLGTVEGFVIFYDIESGASKNILDIYKSDKSQKRINNLYAKGDTIFVATSFGVVLINKNNYSLYDTFTKFGNFSSEINVSAVIKDERIFTATSSGIAVQKPGSTNLVAPESWLNYTSSSSGSFGTIRKFDLYSDKVIAATDNGIYQYNTSWDILTLEAVPVVDFYVDNTKIYAASKNSLYLYDGSEVSLIYNNNSFELTSVAVYNGKIYLGTTSGVIELSNGSEKIIKPDNPASNSFLNMDVDIEGNLWIATGKDGQGIGAMVFDGNHWDVVNYQKFPSLQTNDVFSVRASRTSEAVYLGTWGKGFAIYKDGSLEAYNAGNSPLAGIPSDPNFVVITDIEEDSKGNVWLTNLQNTFLQQLYVLTTEGNWYGYSYTKPLLTSNELTYELEIDQFDTKWFRLFSGRIGLYYYNENSTFSNTNDDIQGYISQTNGLLTNTVTALKVDNRGQLWVGTSLGMNIIPDPSNPSVLNISIPSLRGLSVTSIAVDAIDQKWVGTNKGLLQLSSDGFEVINYFTSLNSPLPDDMIRSITIDKKRGIVYAGTDYGLVKIETTFLQPLESFGEIFAYPSPFIIDNSSENTLIIDGLIDDSYIKIIDINNQLVRDFKAPGGRIAYWDGKDNDGKYVSSGVYLIVAYDREANNVAVSKIAVIRK
ncbi:type IX secretion system anionic LPS delivery protein PorZ [Melioribacter sp. OK-6-Me]|uniref:type IX secretion system anionic LPS delivery protein PorZ n=1 Tax=unclassified Melioribacter TaxID=2627329 RepID=UPI003ED90831